MIPEAIQSLPQGATSIILIGLLIAALVIAYKIMEKVFETVTVAALSGAFYAGLTYLFSAGSMTGFKIDELLLFTFLGATLYMVYSFVISLYRAGTTLAEIPIKLAKALIYPFTGQGPDLPVQKTLEPPPKKGQEKRTEREGPE
ncbi:MAG: hypothetical protein BRC30_01180 [Nanohaloarchaea archaeon SW_7_46_7]|nr:MAG: hypothetical protein BRC30_01180 [Nanohaloarchaea archaeon SW_7_46_7]